MYPHIYIVLPTYIVLAFAGGLAATAYTYWQIERFQVKFVDFIKLLLICAVCGFIGGKILFIVTQIPQLLLHFSIQNLLTLMINSGIVFYGGLFGVLFGVRLFAKIRHYDTTNIFRMVVPAMPLFHGFGRIGCLMAGCCYGKELSSPIILMESVQLNRVPTQLFEVVFEFMLFVVLLIVRRKNSNRNLLRIYLLAYAFFRFINEFFRGDEIRGIFFGLSTAQWISIAIVVYYAVMQIKTVYATSKSIKK